MGQETNDIYKDINDTKRDIERNLDELQASLRASTDDARVRMNESFDAAGNAVGSFGSDLAATLPERIANPLPLLVGGVLVGLAAGLLVPLTSLEKERLQPVSDEIARRAKTARNELLDQGKAVVDDTLSAAKTSVQKHGKEAADTIGV